MCDSSETFPGEFHLLGLRQLPRLPRLVSFCSTSSAPLPLPLLTLSAAQTLPVFPLTVLIVRLCLVGAADTPGCVSLLPASLFSNSNPGWCEQHLIRLSPAVFCRIGFCICLPINFFSPPLFLPPPQTSLGCSVALRYPQPGLVLGVSTRSLIRPSALVCPAFILHSGPYLIFIITFSLCRAVTMCRRTSAPQTQRPKMIPVF